MSISNKMKVSRRRVAESGYLLLMLCVSLALGPRAYAQTQAQPASADSQQMSASTEAPAGAPPSSARPCQAAAPPDPNAATSASRSSVIRLKTRDARNCSALRRPRTRIR